MTKHCSACNASFSCSSDGSGCWCQDYKVSIENLQYLRSTYNDCLCPGCLKQYANEAAGTSGNKE